MRLFDVYHNHEEAHLDFKKRITNETIYELATQFELEPEYIIYLLLKFDIQKDPYVEQKIKEHYSNNHINSNITLVIADTHIGAYTEDINLVACAYNYAYQHNIKNIIHLGDLVQSTLDTPNIKEKDIDKQLSKSLDIFKSTPDINTHILLGNHDYYLPVDKYEYLKQELINLKNTIYLGRRYSYISLCDNDPIRLNHNINCLCNELTPTLPVNLTLEGHHHEYYFEKYNQKNNIFVPQLSNPYGLPGFFIVETTGTEFIIKHIGITPQYTLKEKDIKVLKKEY